MFPPLRTKRKSLCYALAQLWDVEKLADADKYVARVNELLDQLPEDSDHRHIAEREDRGSQIANAEQVHDGMGEPQPEEGHRVGLAR